VSKERIKLMPDYGCHALWKEGGRNILPGDLQLSPETIHRLMLWAEAYDETLNHDYPPDSHFKSDEDRIKFNTEGRSLLERLRHELGEGYEVVYQNHWEH
jgi:hypothetical protein